MSGAEHGIVRQREYLFRDALIVVSQIAAGIAPVSDAALENRVPDESDTILFGIIHHRIRCMTGGVDHLQLTFRIGGQTYLLTILKMLHIPNDYRFSTGSRQIHPGINPLRSLPRTASAC